MITFLTVTRRRLSVALVSAFVVLAAGSIADATVTLRAGASDPEGTTAPALAIGKLCELATKLSNGELDVKPFYQSLGVEQQLAAAVKSGSVDIGYIAVSNAARFTDAFLQFDLPFLFKNDRAYIDVGSVLLAYVLVLSFFHRSAQPRRVYAAVVDAGYISGMTLFMAATSSFLGFVMARDLVAQHVVDFVTPLTRTGRGPGARDPAWAPLQPPAGRPWRR